MMLEKLWSPTGALLQDIRFKTGLNLVIGRKGQHNEEERRSLNGIGKSSLVRLLDYMLLGDAAGQYFHKQKFDFLRKHQHEVCLSLSVQGRHLVLRRRFDNDRLTIEQSEETRRRLIFDGNEKEAKGLLSEWFFPLSDSIRYPQSSFRNLMSFFIKDDLENHARQQPEELITHKGATKADNILLNFYLMGLSNIDLEEFVSQVDVRKKLKDQEKRLVRKLGMNGQLQLSTLRNELVREEDELVILQQSLGEFRVTEVWKQVSGRLAELDSRLEELRLQMQKTVRQLSKLREYTRAAPDNFIMHEVTRHYESINHWLAGKIRKTLEETLTFRQSLADERFRFYYEQISMLEKHYEEMDKESRRFDHERAALLRSVDGDVNASLSQAWSNIARQEVKLETLKQQLAEFEQIERDLLDNEEALLDAKRGVHMALEQDKDNIRHILSLFKEILKQAYEGMRSPDKQKAFLSIEGKVRGGLSLPADIKLSLPAEEALGRYRQKMVLYDLCLFFNMIDRDMPLPRFLIHDGIYHAMENRIKVNLLNYIHRRSLNQVFQYIATFNLEEIMLPDDRQLSGEIYDFSLEENTILQLEDHPKKMLFARSF